MVIFTSFKLSTNKAKLTIWMPNVARESHCWRHEWIVLRKLQLGREYAALERCALRSLNQSFPYEEIIFRDRPRGDAFWWVLGEVLVLLEEALRGYGRHTEALIWCRWLEGREFETTVEY